MDLEVVLLDGVDRHVVFETTADFEVLRLLIKGCESELRDAIAADESRVVLYIPDEVQRFGADLIKSILEESLSPLFAVSKSEGRKLALVSGPIGPPHITISTTYGASRETGELFQALGIPSELNIAVDAVTYKSFSTKQWIDLLKKASSFNPGTSEEASVPLFWAADPSMLDDASLFIHRIITGEITTLEQLRSQMEARSAQRKEDVSRGLLVKEQQSAIVQGQLSAQRYKDQIKKLEAETAQIDGKFADEIRSIADGFAKVEPSLRKECDKIFDSNVQLLSFVKSHATAAALPALSNEALVQLCPALGEFLSRSMQLDMVAKDTNAQYRDQANLLNALQEGEVVPEVVMDFKVENKYGRALTWLPVNTLNTQTVEKDLLEQLKKLPKKAPVDAQGFKIQRPFPQGARTMQQVQTDMQRLAQASQAQSSKAKDFARSVDERLFKTLKACLERFQVELRNAEKNKAALVAESEKAAAKHRDALLKYDGLVFKFNPLPFLADTHGPLLLTLLPVLLVQPMMTSLIAALFGWLTVDPQMDDSSPRGAPSDLLNPLLLSASNAQINQMFTTPLDENKAAAKLLTILTVACGVAPLARHIINLPLTTPIIKPVVFLNFWNLLLHEFESAPHTAHLPAPKQNLLVQALLNLDLVIPFDSGLWGDDLPLLLAEPLQPSSSVNPQDSSRIDWTEREEIVHVSHWNTERCLRALTKYQSTAGTFQSMADGPAEATPLVTVEDNVHGWFFEVFAEWTEGSVYFPTKQFEAALELVRKTKELPIGIDRSAGEMPVELRTMMAFIPPPPPAEGMPRIA